MAKDIYEENQELKRMLYTVEKAILEFRLKQIDMPLEKINIPSVLTPHQAVPYTIQSTCFCGDECSCDEEKEELKRIIESLTARLNGAEAELAQYKNVEIDNGTYEQAIPSDDEEEPEVVLNAVNVTVEKPKRQYKERGGSVFKDFKNLDLNNANFDGNSVIYKKGEE